MAWHIFEKLLEGVANYSPFIGKVWITFLFMFRLIMVASIGDTVYSDEQSAFKCNTLQPGCENVCFNDFSPISQIRFWAVQILFVGTPSIMFIVYAMHAITTIPPTSQAKKPHESKDEITPESDDDAIKKKVRRRRSKKTESSMTSSNGVHLPDYDEVIYTGQNMTALSTKGRISKGGKLDELTSRSSGHVTGIDTESIAAVKRIELKKFIEQQNQPEKKTKKKKAAKSDKVRRKKIYQQDGVSEVVTTFWIEIAYAGQAVLRTIIEAGFLYLQYRLYKFTVPEIYRCERVPCPLVVECFVSRPKEKTLFLIFMYAMTVLSLLLNAIELVILAVKWTRRCGKNAGGEDTIFDRKLPVEVIQCRSRQNGRPPIPNTFPDLGPFPRSHDNSFGDSSGGDTMDSDYRFYDV
ncbi:unnamed protein product [Clavelina lepadiformis]|uniref:Gap junction protein n=2 Tax=Clavelina lepadiformis TaxID=159417 RepID=A0ABP0GN79_CLALP